MRWGAIRSSWTKFFAWIPRKTEDGRWFWLETGFRRRSMEALNPSGVDYKLSDELDELWLTGYADRCLVPVIKVLREHLGYSLKEAKEATEQPTLLVKDIHSRPLCHSPLARAIRAAGGYVEARVANE